MNAEAPASGPPISAGQIAPAIAVTLLGVLLWIGLPASWSPLHAGGKWFLLLFAVTSGLAALLAGRMFSGGRRFQDHPAAWMGIQVLFWNPLTYRLVLAASGAIGLPDAVGSAAALVGLVLLGLPTSLAGAFTCRNPWWIAVFLTRALQCFFASWLPLFPALFYLHVLLIAQVVTWHKYERLNHWACALLLAEQSAAIAWVILFYQAPPA